MFKMKFTIAISLFISFLLFTSTIKNKTRVIEKNISNLSAIILNKTKNINDFIKENISGEKYIIHGSSHKFKNYNEKDNNLLFFENKKLEDLVKN